MYNSVLYVDIYNNRKQDVDDMVVMSQSILEHGMGDGGEVQNVATNAKSTNIFQFCKTGTLRLSYIAPIYISSIISPDRALANKDINEFLSNNFSQRMISIETIVDLHKSGEFDSIEKTDLYKFGIDIVNSSMYYTKSIKFLVITAVLSFILLCCKVFDKRCVKRKV